MVKINGREVSAQEVTDLVCSLYAKATDDEKRAEELETTSNYYETAYQTEGRKRLQAQFVEQAKRERRLAMEIES